MSIVKEKKREEEREETAQRGGRWGRGSSRLFSRVFGGRIRVTFKERSIYGVRSNALWKIHVLYEVRADVNPRVTGGEDTTLQRSPGGPLDSIPPHPFPWDNESSGYDITLGEAYH